MNNVNFDQLKMNVVETASNGAVNEQTIFHFQQNGNIVTAKYSGGGVNRGFLAGKVENNLLGFKYAQQHADGNIYGGKSKCEMIFKSGQITELIENFKWEAGKGRNVFRTLNNYWLLEDVRKLVSRFEDCSLPHEEWNHTAHLLVGLWYCQHHDFNQALRKMKFGVTAYNQATGTINSDTDGYHETITRFWLMVILEFIKSSNKDSDLYNSFVNSRYAKRDYIFNFYDRTHLFSKEARHSWLKPTSKTSNFI